MQQLKSQSIFKVTKRKKFNKKKPKQDGDGGVTIEPTPKSQYRLPTPHRQHLKLHPTPLLSVLRMVRRLFISSQQPLTATKISV